MERVSSDWEDFLYELRISMEQEAKREWVDFLLKTSMEERSKHEWVDFLDNLKDDNFNLKPTCGATLAKPIKLGGVLPPTPCPAYPPPRLEDAMREEAKEAKGDEKTLQWSSFNFGKSFSM